jgi:hypothetical protein
LTSSIEQGVNTQEFDLRVGFPYWIGEKSPKVSDFFRPSARVTDRMGSLTSRGEAKSFEEAAHGLIRHGANSYLNQDPVAIRIDPNAGRTLSRLNENIVPHKHGEEMEIDGYAGLYSTKRSVTSRFATASVFKTPRKQPLPP